MSFGFIGKILRVNLSRDKVTTETPNEFFYRKYFGGRGVIAYHLLKEMTPQVDALSPDNKLNFATGILTGAPFSGSGRNCVGAKSPLTGAYGEAQVGGYWGAELKRSCFDAIIVEGKAKAPVYLWIHDGKAELRDATHLWGKDTGISQSLIRKELNDQMVRTAQIGPGGENQVRYACVINDLRHAAGRSGMGAVMGSKNLKAIAVRGQKKIRISDNETIRKLVIELKENMPDSTLGLHKYGTGHSMDAHATLGNLPYHNFRDGNFPRPDGIGSEKIKETIRIGMNTCFACAIRCKKVVQSKKNFIVNPEYGGPEYETLAALGSNCGIDNLEAICKGNELCNRYGLDTISTGSSIAFAMECFEKGLLTEQETNGIQLTFGNVEIMLKLIKMIAQRKGIGSRLAEGTKRLSEQLGTEAQKLAVHVKGQEVPMHDPRVKRSLGLGYSVSPNGADHGHNMSDLSFSDYGTHSWVDMKSLGVLSPVPTWDFGPNKIRLFRYFVNLRHLSDCLVLCTIPPWSIIQKVELVRGVTGWNTSAYELMKVGERALSLTRFFNFKEGFTAKDDWLPDRFFHPHDVGALSSTTVDPKQLTKAKQTYYQMMDWDEITGAPSIEKFEELNIGWVLDKKN